jgi:prepilin-type processing-associated H-X9-DG protein
VVCTRHSGKANALFANFHVESSDRLPKVLTETGIDQVLNDFTLPAFSAITFG